MNTSGNWHTTPARPVSVREMSHHDSRVEQPQQDLTPPVQSLPATLPATQDDDVPARRLLAHDMDHMIWEHDGDGTVPPPD